MPRRGRAEMSSSRVALRCARSAFPPRLSSDFAPAASKTRAVPWNFTARRSRPARKPISVPQRARASSHGLALGYRPNLAARYLKLRKQLRISSSAARDRVFGIRCARGSEKPPAVCSGAACRFPHSPALGDGDILFEEALEDGTMPICTVNPAALESSHSVTRPDGDPVVCCRHRRAGESR